VETNPEKINPTDFALWKFSKITEQRQQEWPSPWGVGFPGWHIECSAMSMKYLGNHFDIHTGGIDLAPIHHTNERAQSECATGETFVNYWMHNGFINVNNEKMAKSEGNFYTLTDLENHKIRPLAYRFWLLTANYRKTVNFTWEAVLAAQTGLDRLISLLAEIQNKHGNDGKISTSYQEKFSELIADDLNTPQALALIWDLLRDETIEPADKLATILDFDRFLGLDLLSAITEANIEIPKEVTELAKQREQARQDKNYSRSDDLRQEIAQLGYSVDDTDEGPKIRKI
jgi:cysteinyl-tRNA synthetase